ncbi:MAG: sulfite exporter TauE/SafE family protein [Thermoanaerobaculum sp.]|nr:sulfite exporter TauE/SafE family protein [Thermoanaerobaculum sp.]
MTRPSQNLHATTPNERSAFASRRLGIVGAAVLLSVLAFGCALPLGGSGIDLWLPILAFAVVGFVAQMIDGALGMAYGVSSNSLLLNLGVPPAAASASVHAAEVVVTGISGLSHWKMGNLDGRLVRGLLVPGVIGGVLGAYALSSLDGDKIKPFVALYLLLMGLRILTRAWNYRGEQHGAHRHVGLLGFVGGFFDAIGGGGWGPIVTTSLVARGNNPRTAIGSVNFSEFFVTLAESITFVLSLRFAQYWQVILGLLLGGAVAAPLAARLTKKVPAKLLLILVGLLIVGLSARTLLQSVLR